MLCGWAANPAVAAALLFALDIIGEGGGEDETKAVFLLMAGAATVLGLLTLTKIRGIEPGS
jgi:hypothetical protein